jgi:hypothetical protein
MQKDCDNLWHRFYAATEEALTYMAQDKWVPVSDDEDMHISFKYLPGYKRSAIKAEVSSVVLLGIYECSCH